MQSQRQRMAARDAGFKTAKPDRFTPLLADLRKGLGDNWAFYEECIEGVLHAATKQQDTAAWFEQMQQLVEGIGKVQFSHQGILFLLEDMGIHPPKQQSWGEGAGETRKYQSPPHSLPDDCLWVSLKPTANMGPYPVRPSSTMPTPIVLRSLRPNTPVLADCSVPRALPAHPQQQHLPAQTQAQPYQQKQKQRQPQVLRDGVLPFDFSATVQPSLTFPAWKDFRNYHCPPDEITAPEGYLPPPPNPLRASSHDPVFFSDSALRAEVAEAFSSEIFASRSNSQSTRGPIHQQHQRLPYDVHDNDLVAWKTRLEGRHGEVKANGATGTWPPWNYRFDLDL